MKAKLCNRKFRSGYLIWLLISFSLEKAARKRGTRAGTSNSRMVSQRVFLGTVNVSDSLNIGLHVFFLAFVRFRYNNIQYKNLHKFKFAAFSVPLGLYIFD